MSLTPYPSPKTTSIAEAVNPDSKTSKTNVPRRKTISIAEAVNPDSGTSKTNKNNSSNTSEDTFAFKFDTEALSDTIRINRHVNYIVQYDEARELDAIQKNIKIEDLSLKSKVNLEFDLQSNNKKNIAEINNIIGIKNEIVDSIFDNIENQFKSVLKRINNVSYINSKIEQKIKNYNDLYTDIQTGIIKRKETINDLDLGIKLYSRLANNDTTSELNMLTNYFVNNYFDTRQNKVTNKVEEKFSLDLEEYSADIKVLGDISRMSRENLMLDFNNMSDNIGFDSTEFIIQNFINNTRSMYTLMPGCLLDIEEDTAIAKNTSSDELISYSCESNDIVVWDVINLSKKQISVKDFLEYNNVSNENSIFRSTESENVVNAITFSRVDISYPDVSPVSRSIYDRNFTGFINSSSFDIYSNNNNLLNLTSNSTDDFLGFLSNDAKNFANLCIANRINFAPFLRVLNENNLIDGNVKLASGSDLNTLYVSDVLSGKFYVSNNTSETYNYIYNTSSNSSLDKFIPRTIIFSNLIGLRDRNFTELKDFTRIFERALNDNIYNVFYKRKPLFVLSDSGTGINFNINNVSATVSSNQISVRSNISDFYSNKNFNHVEFKIKLDSLVKKAKLLRMESLGIDLSPFNDVALNIKNSNNRINFSSYSHDDKLQTSILNKDNTLFKVLFEKDQQDPDVYVNNISFNYKSKLINEKEYRSNTGLIVNEDLEQHKKISDVLSNYYPKGQFFSTTTFLLSLLSDFKRYSGNFSNSNRDKNEILTEIFYMHYLNNSDKDDVIKEIAKRFIFNAIKNDRSTNSFSSNSIKKYQYDTRVYENYKSKIKKELKNFEGEDSEAQEKADAVMLELTDQYLNSNDYLSLMQNEVYSEEYIREVSSLYNFNLIFVHKMFKDIGIHIDSSINASRVKKTNYIFQFLPFSNLFLSSRANGSLENVSFRLFKKEFELSLTKDTNDDFIVQNDRLLNMKNTSFSILVECLKDNSLIDIPTENNILNFEEKFEFLCKDRYSIFSSVCKTIKNMLAFSDTSYANQNFSNEEDVENYIDSQPELVDCVINMIKVYSDFYQNVIKNILFDYSLYFFDKLVKPYNFESKASLINDNILLGPQSKSFVLDTFNLRNESGSTYFNNTFEKINYNLDTDNNLSKSFQYLINEIDKEDSKLKIKSDISQIVNQNTPFFKLTNENYFYRKMLKVINDIKKSDLMQAVSFDITRTVLKQKMMINSNVDKIKNESLTNFYQKIELDENMFFKLISSKYYQNLLIKNIKDIKNRNTDLDELSASINNDQERFLEQSNLFEQVKEEKSYKEIDNNINNAYCFNVKTEDLLVNNSNKLIKIIILPKDIRNVQKLYVPIVYYFSTNILSLNNSYTSSNLHMFVENSSGANITYEDIDYSELDLSQGAVINTDVEDRIKEIIQQKVVNVGENKIKTNTIFESIIENHRKSSDFRKIIAAKFDIDVNKNNYDDRKELTDILSVIPENVVSNIFNKSKREIYENIDNVEFYNEFYEMNNSVNYLLSSKEDTSYISKTDVYDKYLLSIPEKLLYYNKELRTTINNIFANTLTNIPNTNSVPSSFSNLLYQASFIDANINIDSTSENNDLTNKLNYFEESYDSDRDSLVFTIKMELL